MTGPGPVAHSRKLKRRQRRESACRRERAFGAVKRRRLRNYRSAPSLPSFTSLRVNFFLFLLGLLNDLLRNVRRHFFVAGHFARVEGTALR